MKCTIFVAFVTARFPCPVFSAPVPFSIEAMDPGQSGYTSHVGAAARHELSTAGRTTCNHRAGRHYSRQD